MTKERSKIATILIIVVFLGLLVGIPLLHNHPNYLIEPANCKANILQISLQSIVLVVITTTFLVLQQLERIPTQRILMFSPSFKGFIFINKAPPIS